MTDLEPKLLDETFRDYAWNYFQLHADQRIKVFQFYVTLSTALIGGFLLALRQGFNNKWIAILGILLTFVSFIFWRLDQRTKQLVKNAEEALKLLDAQYDLPDINGAPHPLRIMSRDDYMTTHLKTGWLWNGHFSYSRCFHWIFITFSLTGVGASLASLLFSF